MLVPAVWRKFLLVVHIVTSVGFPGAVAGFLALAIVGATSGDAVVVRSVYIAMAVMTWDVIVPLAAASLLIGIVESLVTPWGLFRFYWVIVKLVLTLVALAVLMVQTSTINVLSTASLRGDLSMLGGQRMGMILHGAGGLAVLIVVTVLSIYKPRGMTRYGAGKLEPAS
jgi:hypothetical protein